MLDKVKNFLLDKKPIHFLIAILVVGLIYGSLSQYMKITRFSELAGKTRITSVKVSHIVLGTAENIYSTVSTIAALKSGRRFIGYEINSEYIELSNKRINN